MNDAIAGMTDVLGYDSDLEFLGGALELVRLAAMVRIRARERAGLALRDPVLVMTEGEAAPDPATLIQALADKQALHAARVRATGKLPALLSLEATFGLDGFERDVVLLALAPAIDSSFNQLFGRAKGQAYRAPLDIDVALTLLTDSFEERMARRKTFTPTGRLLANNLLLIGRGSPGDGADAFLAMELRLPGRLVTLLLGQGGEDESLQAFSHLVEPEETLARVVLPPEDKRRLLELLSLHDNYVQALATWGLREAIPYGRGVTLLFAGPPGTGKTLTARALANHLGRRLLVVDASRLAGQSQHVEENLDNLLREARLQRAILFFDECESLFAAQNRFGGHVPALLQALERFEGICILATNVPKALDFALDRRILYRVNFELPGPTAREHIWELHMPAAFPRTPDVDLGYIARRYEFTGGLIKNTVLLAAGAAAARAARGLEAAVSQRDLLEAAHSQLRHRLAEFADRDVSDLRLTDLILPEDLRKQVMEIIEAVAAQSIVFREWGFGRKFNKGRGLSALFDGEPGTGKTLAAEVIAAELGLSLFRVNVANVVSKYIGETEKNLTRIFGEAKASQSVLLFDEADSLFAKRVEVKASNDRFANMETNVLLQLIERYEGLVLLTTNLKTSIDNAFERRLSFKLNFPFPDAAMRTTIWRQLVPDTAPIERDVDYDLLGASYDLSGGSIKNAVLRAAYRAAATVTKLDMNLFEEAAKRECQAAGKLFRVARRDDAW